MKQFNHYFGSDYWVHMDGYYRAIIRHAEDGWYGGACMSSEKSAPLHGPYRFKYIAKKIALQQLELIKDAE
jgi:hypothetical protein